MPGACLTAARRLSRAALWQPEWVFLLMFGSNGNGPIPHVVAEQGCLNSWQPEWVFWLLVFGSNGNGDDPCI